MVAFACSVLALIVMTVPIVLYGRRRPRDQVFTWGEAMLGSVYVASIAFIAFGISPHQFIVWADSDLGWRSDRFLVGPGEVLADVPFDIPYTALRDFIVVNIHVVFAVAMVMLWARWQKRGEVSAGDVTVDSDYGRPLVDSNA
jgi:hypothetical protein